MGGSSSREQVPAEQREIESLAASTGALPTLEKAFSTLSDPQTNSIPLSSLQQCFSITFTNTSSSETPTIPDRFPILLDHLGQSIVDLFFPVEIGGITWIEFLKGYIRCCGRTATSVSLNNLCRVFDAAATKAGLPAKLQFELEDCAGKLSGFLLPADVFMLLMMCWVMYSDSRSSKCVVRKLDHGLPEIQSLVLSAVVTCDEVGSDLNVYDCDIMDLDVQLPAGKIHLWALKTVPSLADCFSQFLHARLQSSFISKEKSEQSLTSVSDSSSTSTCNTPLLTCGRAWAISLSLRSTMSEEILKACFPGDKDGINENLLYRSSLNGKGLNRFWSNVEGYNGPVLILLAASLEDSDANSNARRLVIGALTHQGFENKDAFYGSSGSLYAMSPVFHVYTASGKEKNFVYSHLHPAGRAYDPHPKPVGIAFGGSSGNERIFIDEDFSRVTIRHHAVDKTYQHGSLFHNQVKYIQAVTIIGLSHNQGFLPVEASVVEVEVWGLGGSRVKEIQTSYQKREQLFTNQRRTVDLKTFSNWEDSPEKIMMDMVSNPNAVRREDR